MSRRKRKNRLNVKLLVILLVVAAVIGVSMVVARRINRSILSKRALAAGHAAFEDKDWPAAVKSFREYLERNPDDIEILKKYAEALMSTRPLDARVITGAISAYRRIMQLDPLDGIAYEKLARLFNITGNFEELAFIARLRLKHNPNDRKAQLWLVDALVRLNKTMEARQTLQTLIEVEELEALPEKHVEYVQACVQMSSLVGSQDSSEMVADSEDSSQMKTPLEWLNKALEYAPDSVDVLVHRARFHRKAADVPGTSEEDRLALLGLARKDLESADAIGTNDPQIRYILCAEWLAHGELDRVAAELQAVDELPKETLEEHFFDINNWTVVKFLLASELAVRKGATTAAIIIGAVLGNIAFCLVKLPVCQSARVCEQMLSKDDEVFDIDDAVTPGHRTNVTQGLVRTPVVNHDAHVGGIDNSVIVEVDDGDDWRLIYILAPFSAGTGRYKVEGETVS